MSMGACYSINTGNICKLDKTWNEAKARKGIVVSLKQGWKRIFAFE